MSVIALERLIEKIMYSRACKSPLFNVRLRPVAVYSLPINCFYDLSIQNQIKMHLNSYNQERIKVVMQLTRHVVVTIIAT